MSRNKSHIDAHAAGPGKPFNVPLQKAEFMLFDLSVIVVNYNTHHLLDEFFLNLNKAAEQLRVQVLMIDNASSDASPDYLKSMSESVSVIFNDTNVGFGRANNQAVPFVEGRYVLLLNTDAFVAPDTLTKTVAWMDANPECGVLGVKLTDRESGLQPSCRYFPTPINVFLNRTGLDRFLPWVRGVDDMTWGHASVRECDWVPGCYYLIRRETVNAVGLFDPRFFMYYEEVDHCRRVKAAGWKVLFYPHTSVVHIGGESAKTTGKVTQAGRQISNLQIESELLYFRKHYGVFGLVVHMVLLLLGDAWLMLKAILKGRGWPVVVSNWRHALLCICTLYKTRLATLPTR